MTDFGIVRGKTGSGPSSAIMDFVVSKSQVSWLVGATGAAAVLGILAGISLIGRLVGA